jgi:predicted nucleic-acid-binding protein
VAEAFVAKGAWVSQLVLMETVLVFGSVYELDAEQLATAVEMLLQHKDLTIEDSESVFGALEQFRKRPTVRFSNCLVLEAARRAGHLPLGTFDRGLGGRAARVAPHGAALPGPGPTPASDSDETHNPFPLCVQRCRGVAASCPWAASRPRCTEQRPPPDGPRGSLAGNSSTLRRRATA